MKRDGRFSRNAVSLGMWCDACCGPLSRSRFYTEPGDLPDPGGPSRAILSAWLSIRSPRPRSDIASSWRSAGRAGWCHARSGLRSAISRSSTAKDAAGCLVLKMGSGTAGRASDGSRRTHPAGSSALRVDTTTSDGTASASSAANASTEPHESCACGAFDSWGPHNEDSTSTNGGGVGRLVTPGMNPGFLSTEIEASGGPGLARCRR